MRPTLYSFVLIGKEPIPNNGYFRYSLRNWLEMIQ
jgi:hypothetical protein